MWYRLSLIKAYTFIILLQKGYDVAFPKCYGAPYPKKIA